jgi:hypothetical protein
LNLLRGLNPKFRHVKPVLTSKSHTFMSARSYLLLEELQLQQDDKNEAGQALLATHGASTGSGGSAGSGAGGFAPSGGSSSGAGGSSSTDHGGHRGSKPKSKRRGRGPNGGSASSGGGGGPQRTPTP